MFGALGLALCAFGTAHAQAKFSFATTPGQLPKTVVPTRYTLSVVPNPKTLTFTGWEAVDINVKAPTKTIVLNELGLAVSKAELGPVLRTGNQLSLLASSQKRTVPSIKADDAAQTLTLTFPKIVAPGAYSLTINYTGKVGL